MKILFESLKNDIFNKFKKIFENEYRRVNIKKIDLKKIRSVNVLKINRYNFLGNDILFYNGIEFLHGVHEIFIDEPYKADLKDGAYIIDCGAHIGLSIIYYKRTYSNVHILAFEPDEKNYSLLSKNIKSYSFSNVELKKEAVWVKNGYLNFSQEGNMSSKILENDIDKTNSQVKASRLRDFINKPVDLLKIDIEGAEYQVMNDIEDTLHFVKNIFLEYHGSFAKNFELVELLQMLSRNHFDFYIKEAHPSYSTPFHRTENNVIYDLQLNIFCFKNHE